MVKIRQYLGFKLKTQTAFRVFQTVLFQNFYHTARIIRIFTEKEGSGSTAAEGPQHSCSAKCITDSDVVEIHLFALAAAGTNQTI